MKRCLAVLLLVALIVPGVAGATTTQSLSPCSLSRLTLALGATQRFSAARPFRGDLTSITAIQVTNDGPACRFPVAPSVSFDFSPPGAVALLSAARSTTTTGPAQVLRARQRMDLVAYVRVVSGARVGYCEPRTALAIAITLDRPGRGGARYLFARRISGVCSNPAPPASNFGVVWQDRWVL